MVSYRLAKKSTVNCVTQERKNWIIYRKAEIKTFLFCFKRSIYFSPLFAGNLNGL
ncbi:MAG: hypothetical protein LBC74_04840 [Planctomycetaceae bacterium]|nr:hypothetical protein [Planctomycetaceae bacterium]